MSHTSIVVVIASSIIISSVFATGCGSDGGSGTEGPPPPAASSSAHSDIIIIPTLPIQCDYVGTEQNLHNGRGSCTCWLAGPDGTVGPMWTPPDCTPCGCIFTE